MAHQRRTESPTLDLALFRLGNFRWGNVGMLSYSAGFSAMFFGLILFLVDVWGWSIIQAGFAVAIALVGTTAGVADTLAGFDRLWWFTIASGLLTAAGGLPLRTDRHAPLGHTPRVEL